MSHGNVARQCRTAMSHGNVARQCRTAMSDGFSGTKRIVNISSTSNTKIRVFATAKFNNASDDQNVCNMYNSKLAMNFDTYLGDSVTKSVNLNPYAKCYSPITAGDIDFHLSMETTVTRVTPNDTDSSISLNETNVGTNRGTGDDDADNSDVYSIINKLRIGNANRIVIAYLNINSIRNKIDMLSTIVSNKIDMLSTIVRNKIDMLSTIVKNKIDMLSTRVRNKIDMLSTRVRNKIDMLSTIVSNKIDMLSTIVRNKIDMLSTIVRNKIDMLSTRVRNKIDMLSTRVRNKIDMLSTRVRNKIDMLSTIVRNKIDMLSTIVRNKIDMLSTRVRNKIDCFQL